MGKIIGLSGTHGTGKSSILNELASRGYAVDRTQISREVQQKLGWTSLKEVEKSEDNLWEFQNLVSQSLAERDERILDGAFTVFVERTPADVWAYAYQWCKRLNLPSVNETAASYQDSCFAMLEAKYPFVFVVPQSNAVQFFEEPNRADLESRNDVDTTIRFVLEYLDTPHHVLIETSVSGRADEIEGYVNELKGS